MPYRLEREARLHHETAASARPGLQRAAVKLDPLPHPCEPIASAIPGECSSTVVCHLDLDLTHAVANDDGSLCRARVLDDVRERLLQDPIGGDVDAGR